MLNWFKRILYLSHSWLWDHNKTDGQDWSYGTWFLELWIYQCLEMYYVAIPMLYTQDWSYGTWILEFWIYQCLKMYYVAIPMLYTHRFSHSSHSIFSVSKITHLLNVSFAKSVAFYLSYNPSGFYQAVDIQVQPLWNVQMFLCPLCHFPKSFSIRDWVNRNYDAVLSTQTHLNGHSFCVVNYDYQQWNPAQPLLPNTVCYGKFFNNASHLIWTKQIFNTFS